MASSLQLYCGMASIANLFRNRRKRAPGRGTVLIVSRKAALTDRLKREGAAAAMRTLTAKTTAEAMRRAERADINAAVIDVRFADGGMDGLELALNLRDYDSSLPVWLADSAGGPEGDVALFPAGRHNGLRFSPRRIFSGLHGIFGQVRSHAVKGGA